MALNQTISSTIEAQKEIAKEAYSSYCDALDSDYCKKEDEYEKLTTLLIQSYDKKQSDLNQKIEKEKEFF